MTVEAPVRRQYSDQDIVGALQAVDANQGAVKPTARLLAIPETTLRHWKDEDVERAARARRSMLGAKADEGLAERYLDIAAAAQDRVMEALPKTNAYHAMLISGISFDKRQLALGRPTSRTESVSIRYISPGSLRRQARQVIDVEVAGGRRARAPKVAGGLGRARTLALGRDVKAKPKRKRKITTKEPELTT